jgi:hypothetical protein
MPAWFDKRSAANPAWSETQAGWSGVGARFVRIPESNSPFSPGNISQRAAQRLNGQTAILSPILLNYENESG